MAIIKRITRLFQADFHAVLDLVEEPELLLRQALREMEAALARDEASLASRRRTLRQLEARAADLERSGQDIDSQLDLCFEAGEEQLARSLVRRQLEIERARQALSDRRQSLEQTLAEQEASLAENRRKLAAMHEQVQILTEAQAAEPAFGEGPPARWSAAVRDEEVEVAFLREKQQRRPS